MTLLYRVRTQPFKRAYGDYDANHQLAKQQAADLDADPDTMFRARWKRAVGANVIPLGFKPYVDNSGNLYAVGDVNGHRMLYVVKEAGNEAPDVELLATTPGTKRKELINGIPPVMRLSRKKLREMGVMNGGKIDPLFEDFIKFTPAVSGTRPLNIKGFDNVAASDEEQLASDERVMSRVPKDFDTKEWKIADESVPVALPGATRQRRRGIETRQSTVPANIRFEHAMSNYFAEHGDQLGALNEKITQMLSGPNYDGSLKDEPQTSSIASRFMDPRMIFGELSAVSLKDMADYLDAVYNYNLLKRYGYMDHTAPSPDNLNEAQKMGSILSEMAQNGASPKTLSDRIMFNVDGSDRTGLKGMKPKMVTEVPKLGRGGHVVYDENGKVVMVPTPDGKPVQARSIVKDPWTGNSDLGPVVFTPDHVNISEKAHLGTSQRPEPTEETVVSPAADLSSLGDEVEVEKAPETTVPVKPLLRSTSEMWAVYSNRPKRGLVQDDSGKVDIVKSSTSSLFKSRMKGSR